MEKLGKVIEESTISYIDMLNRNELLFTWERVDDPAFETENDAYVCKNIMLTTKIKEFLPFETETSVILELNRIFSSKHVYIYSITETPRMIISDEQRVNTTPSGEKISTEVYNPYTFEDQTIVVDKAFVIKGLSIRCSIKGSADNKIFKGTKPEILNHLSNTLKIKPYPKDNIIQEPGLYEMKKSEFKEQLDKAVKNPTTLFYHRAEIDEYKLIRITVTSIPVSIIGEK